MNYLLYILLALVVVFGAILIVILSRMAKLQEEVKSSVTQSVTQSMSEGITRLMTSLSNISEKYGEISSKLLTLKDISNDTKSLKNYLENPRIRGRWGERMVEDIINLVGLQENINYIKQKSIDRGDGKTVRPDFTFFLPNGKKINLDSKFSLENYMKFVEAQSPADKENYKKAFISDVKKTIKDVANRNYINEETVDFAIVFIASEAVYSFVLSENPTIIDEALKEKIVLSSPNNLYAILSSVRQAYRYYTLEKASKEILNLLYRFNLEWGKITNELDKLGKQLDTVRNTFDKVSTTRRTKLESVLSDIEEKRKSVLLSKEETEIYKQ